MSTWHAVPIGAYAGSRGEEEPRWLGEPGAEIVAILDRWREPDARHFRVRTTDGREHHLRYPEPDGPWQRLDPEAPPQP